VLIDPGVVDRDYGPWAGHRQADVEQWFGSLDAAPGVEGSDQFAAAS
jgi:probable phosphoglycerate mutase